MDSADPQNVSYPGWLNRAVLYQIYPQSFLDTNGDGIGDLPGIIAKLDYIQELGCDTLWLNPCFESPFKDAGYDVRDFRRVAPRYGTNEDLYRLFHDAHARGMRVILDLVAGHTSLDHPWFVESARPERNAYSDYYIWTNTVWDEVPPDLRFINGYSDRDGQFHVNFFHSQPALNYGFAEPDPRYPWQQPVTAPGPRAVRRELMDIMKFWLDAGADGFRVDMAFSLVKGPGNRAATVAFWQEIRQWMRRNWPEAALIAEWGNPTAAVEAGFDADFLIHFGSPAYTSLFRKHYPDHLGTGQSADTFSYFDERGKGTVTTFLREYTTHLDSTSGKGLVSIPSGNHDTAPRLGLDRDLADLKVIFTFLLTQPGLPVIYYGDEIGMRGVPDLPSKEGGYVRTQVRTPLPWDPGQANAGFSSASPRELYLPLEEPTPGNQGEELREHIRSLLALRAREPALTAEGEFRVLHAGKGHPLFAYLRGSGTASFLVALNPAKDEQTGRLSDLPAGTWKPVGEQAFELRGDALTLPGKSSLLLRRQE